MEKNYKFVEVFASLGCSWNLQDNVFNGLKKYVCYLYGFRKKDINYVRISIMFGMSYFSAGTPAIIR